MSDRVVVDFTTGRKKWRRTYQFGCRKQNGEPGIVARLRGGIFKIRNKMHGYKSTPLLRTSGEMFEGTSEQTIIHRRYYKLMYFSYLM